MEYPRMIKLTTGVDEPCYLHCASITRVIGMTFSDGEHCSKVFLGTRQQPLNVHVSETAEEVVAIMEATDKGRPNGM